MSRSDFANASENATLQVKAGVKLVLAKEKLARQEAGESVSMGQILAEALADHFKDKPEYLRILRASGYEIT